MGNGKFDLFSHDIVKNRSSFSTCKFNNYFRTTIDDAAGMMIGFLDSTVAKVLFAEFTRFK